MSDFTISGASTIIECKYPYRTDVAVPVSLPTGESKLGSEVHDCAAKFINTAEATELLDAATHRVWAAARVWILSHWRATWVAEPAYAWDPMQDRARRLGVDIGREYARHGKLGFEVAGTLDVDSVEGDTVYVYEFGTGYDVSHKFHQLRLQCAVSALANGCTRAVGQVIRLDETGSYPQKPIELDEFELAAIRGEFAEYLTEVDGSEPRPGEHCGRCNLAPACPASAAIVQELVPVAALVRPGWGLVIQSADHARWLHDMQRLVAKAAEAVKEAVKAYTPKAGLVLSNGDLLYEGTRTVTRVDHARVEALARSLGATDEQIEACSRPVVESAGLKVKKAAQPKKSKEAA